MRTPEEQAKLLALCKLKGASWYLLAREAQRPDGIDRLWNGETLEASDEADKAKAIIRASREDLTRHMDAAQADVDRATRGGARLITVLDEDYPQTLRLIYNLPPFLFVRGHITEADLRSVAVVGTRQASDIGLRRARNMATLLTERGVTVVSGLARGIDTAAHTAALEAGGRTIAVVGTGILRCYPAENRPLQEQIIDKGAGAVVSQFWPDAPGATYTFPRRNVTMSGIAQGSVVIEASSTSGAKMQARIALEHGKKVFLIRSLTQDQPWAESYVTKRGAIMVDDVGDVIQALADPDRIHAADARRQQLALDIW
ncbi:DNA-processing protein DprA [Nonomuraea angiospora]|uniref:DNA-processing protein DprA n=1 Tax=Nonomuraea angiospora TaxID=46172 RepID=UPI00344B6760